MFRVTGLNFFFLEQNINFMHFERYFDFQNASNSTFLENLKKFYVSSVNLGRVGLP